MMSQQKNQGDPLKILLVEDNISHAEMVIRSFESNRVTNNISHVDDGERAIDYLHQRGDYADTELFSRPDLILLDLRLPKIDGLEVLAHIKSSEDLLTIPVVILSTSSTELDMARAYKHHANSYLVKPLDFKRFTEMMHDLVYYWLVWNHLPFRTR